MSHYTECTNCGSRDHNRSHCPMPKGMFTRLIAC
jgi:hypothetical protein